MWASSMAENGILKIGKKTDFECHMMEHQLGAYTDCNHGKGLAVLHPVYYRHIFKYGIEKFKRFAVKVWDVDTKGLDDEKIALAGINALSEFIKEAGLPTNFKELGVDPSLDLKAVANSCVLNSNGCKQLTHEEVYEIFLECKGE